MNKTLSGIMLAICLTAMSFCLYAQTEKCEWKDRVMSEKIAFLTKELDLTPSEAQTFWPIYNEVVKLRFSARGDVMKAFGELEKGIQSGKSEKEITSLTDKYLVSLENMHKADKEAADKFREVLPVRKFAKLYVAEEKFRREQIHRLHHFQANR